MSHQVTETDFFNLEEYTEGSYVLFCLRSRIPTTQEEAFIKTVISDHRHSDK